ncbi:maltose/maltodextrin ABC transporter ATP-binding protein MalK [Endozoicomonas sp. SM1973]|uniref:Maltose/maltodextrin ABC transporter ATP-binding protein MalK n=1 Tax=Spartinivicinus marinus TaxID=2994442 RepID=A0A853I9Z8_9GAMM|nr:maltose/maltodextrin ABC transporter ATP-binding protein MalK [Spartinivicinus marinus]MCX4028389.1 maltose/maltodextrin ABC transporter ATP-binding protein MalK [Spartinivicinus marinus]NYZ68612.1 maltose/maltodextrin ABC transporter ATP-binding protein MalK [Spartinivicinus marinus]
MASITLHNICKRYGNANISNNINLDIAAGEFVVFVGPSGCGKSTLLRMIAGLEDITSGDLYIGEQHVNQIPPKDRPVGMVFQSYALYPHMTVADNMAFGLKLAKANQSVTQEKVSQVAQALQLDNLLARKPKDLSGGQRQRVAIGRTIVREPKVLLFDEPLSNLDASLRVKMRIELSKLHKRLGATMIYVTHDQVEAMTLADKIVVLENGNVSQVGKPLELYHYPNNQFVAGFIGSPQMNFIPCKVIESSSTTVAVQFINNKTLNLHLDGTHIKAGEHATLGIRPEHICNAEEADISFDCKVNVVERLGDETMVYGELPGLVDEFIIRTHGNTITQENDNYNVGVKAQCCHLFNQLGEACKRLYQEPSLSYQ